MSEGSPPWHAAYDPEAFRRLGHQAVDDLADYLGRALSGEAMPVLGAASFGAVEAAFQPEAGAGHERGFWRDLLQHAHHLHHPGYIGHQVAPIVPAAALVEMVSTMLNNGMAIWEMGPANTACEKRMVQILAQQVGWSSGADGVLTHGGSLGNLTALLAARQARAQGDAWSDGQTRPGTFLASAQNHYSIDRAVRIMGMGAQGVTQVACDRRHRLDPADLPRALEAARAAGREVLGVVACAGTTATGSFDPLPAIADFCEAHGLWLHVDGAHGASFLLDAGLRSRLAGIERADSVVWDLHKMMLAPPLITAVLFRDGAHSHGTFVQKASYLFSEGEPCSPDIGRRTVECTKRALGATPISFGRPWARSS
ncbi:MAG: pyridoxal-dependent decarboxylase [Planctomycetota bacterium]